MRPQDQLRMTQGRQLYMFIEEHCKSVNDFAKDIGYPPSTVWNWICDQPAQIPMQKLAVIGEYFADLTGTPPSFFIMRLTLAHEAVIEVMLNWQKRQNHPKRTKRNNGDQK